MQRDPVTGNHCPNAVTRFEPRSFGEWFVHQGLVTSACLHVPAPTDVEIIEWVPGSRRDGDEEAGRGLGHVWQIQHAARHEPRFCFEPVSPDYVIRVPQRYAEYRAQATRRQLDILASHGRPIPLYDRELPRPSRRVRFREALMSVPTRLGRYPRLRYALLKLLVSRPALVFVYLRQLAKYGVAGFRHTHQVTVAPAQVPDAVHAE